MAINENIYGSAENWRDCYYNDNINKRKKAYFGTNQSQLQQGVTANKLSYAEPIDKSLSYCGLGTECALSHWWYITDVDGTLGVNDRQDRFVTNFFFSEITANLDSYIEYSLYDILTMKRYIGWQQTVEANFNLNKVIEPMTHIPPKCMVLLIRVVVANTSGTLAEFDLNTWINTQHTSYPRLKYAYVFAYMGETGSTVQTPDRRIGGLNMPITRQFRACTLSLLDEYTIESKNFSMYSYFLPQQAVFGIYIRTYPAQYSDSDTAVFACLPEDFDETKLHYQYISQSFPKYIDAYIDYYEGIDEDIKKTVACFGLFFTDKESVAEGGTFTNNDMYIGLLDNDGIGHGDYLRGENTVNAPQNDYNDMSQSGYDYTKEVDKTKYKNDTLFYDSALANGFTRFWVLDSTQVSSLLSELYTIMSEVDPDEPIEKYSQQVFLTNNPIDCVVSLKKFPLQNVPSILGPAYIQLGSKTTNILASPLAKSCGVYYFTFSSSSNTSLYPHYNKSFLDYEPYTTVKITIPFCGTVQIPTTYLYDYGGVTIALVIDFISGACTGYVMARGITIDSVSGNCAISLPLSGIQSATLDSQIHSVAMAREKQQTTLGTGLIAGAVAIGIGIATGGVATAIGGAAAVIGSFMHAEDTGQQINYELTHMQTPLKQVSAASGQIAHTYDMRCKMLISRPKIQAGFGEDQQDEYANTIGFACLLSGKVEDFNGFTVGNIDVTGISATADELQMIRNAFARGVYL